MRKTTKSAVGRSLAALALLMALAQPAAADPFGGRAGTDAVFAKAGRFMEFLLDSVQSVFFADGTYIETDN